MKNKKIASNQERFRALKLAEIKMTDKEDLQNCISDLVKTASLDKEEATIVANAIRSKYLPNILRESGLMEAVNLDDDLETENFATDTENEDDSMELHHFEDDEDVDKDVELEDLDEVDDADNTATFKIEVPADMVDAAKRAVEEALDNLMENMSTEEDMNDDMEMEDEDSDMEDEESDMEDDESDMEMDTDMGDELDMDDEEMVEDDDSEAEMHKTSNKVNKMTKQALAARRAEREEILRRLASEEEKYPASANFKYNEDMVNMPGKTEYPVFKFDGQNPMESDNPTYADQKVPTLNDLSEHPGVSQSKMEGTPSGDLEYVVNWDELEKTPSEGLDVENPAIPTEMPMEHNTQPSSNARVAAKSMVECVDCGHRMALTEAEMETAECPECTRTAKKHDKKHDDHEEMDHDGKKDRESATITVAPNAKVQVATSLDTARIKTAYSCSSKLALAGIIETSEVDTYAEQMLNDNLKADAMIRQTKLLLKSAQASTERVAAAAAERMNNVRTASTMGISTSPAFSGSAPANGAALDIQSALKGTWTMPQIED